MINGWSFGIDLGTTNSCIAVSNTKLAPKLVNVKGSNKGILPSCVKYLSRDEVVVGIEAYNHKELPSVVFSAKRLMNDGDVECIPVVAENGEQFNVSPIEVGGHVLKHMLDAASEYIGTAVDTVTITVPAYFNEKARYNTLLAGVKAGIPKENITLISEPTAAALAYGVNLKSKIEEVIVYDLGGGTFDSSLVRITSTGSLPEFKVIATGGDPNLGGDDADIGLAIEVLNRCFCDIPEEVSIDDVDRTSAAFKQLVHECEQIKKTGSTVSFSQEVDNSILKSNKLSKHYRVPIVIHDKDIEKCIYENLYVPTKSETDRVLRHGKNVQRMLLIGGSTKSSVIINSLKSEYDLSIKWYTDPDKSVAYGAAIYMSLKENQNGSKLQDVTQQPLGVASTDDRGMPLMNVLIPQNSPLPAHGKILHLETSYDNQDTAIIQVYQGLKRIPMENTLLGEVVIEDIPLKPKGKVRYDITLTVDINGILSADISEFYTENNEKTITKKREFHKEITRMASGSNGNDKAQSETSKADVIKNRRRMRLRSLVSEDQYEEKLKELESLTSVSEITEFFDKLSVSQREW